MQWTKPKSVRQIGSVPERGRVYMEDYVMRFAKELSARSQGMEKGAMLLGNTHLYNGEKIYQISGIIEIPNFSGRSGPTFSQDMWDAIYQEIKENFTDLEIVGWYYSCRGFALKEASKLLEMHKANFQHRDKVLYIYEETDREDSFFLYRNGQFERQKGYYIYYEKNPEMLAYMEKEANRHVHIIEQEDDRVVRNIRGIMEEKEKDKQIKKEKEAKRNYGMGILVALIAIMIGTSALRNQTTLDNVEEQLQNLKELTLGKEKEEKTTVETMGGNLVKMTATPAAVEVVTEGAVAK